jgi:hypothetical protein
MIMSLAFDEVEIRKSPPVRAGQLSLAREDLGCLQVVRDGRAAAVEAGQRHQRAERPHAEEVEKERLFITMSR